MPPSEDEKKLIQECIEVHRRMVSHHRRQILDLTRRLNQSEYKMESLQMEIKK
jgi:hypothetical protein